MTEPIEESSPAVRVLHDPADWDRIEPEWNALFEASPQAATPLNFAWLREWWRIYGEACGAGDRPLRIITAWRGPRLVAALPLYLGLHGRAMLNVRRLGFLGTGEPEADAICPDYLNLLARPGEAEACLGPIRLALRAMAWDRLDLADIPADSPLLRWAEADREPVEREVIDRGECPIANLEGGFEEYLKRLSSKTRQHARQYLRGAERAGAAFELADAGNVDSFFDDLARLHQERWIAEGQPGCFASARFAEFHRTMARRWVPSGEAALGRLAVGGEPIGVLYGFATGGKFDYYQSGIRRECPIESPGTAINLMLMRALAERGVTHYDFLRGTSTYKQKLATEGRSLSSLVLRRPTLRGRAYESARVVGRGVRGLIRSARRPFRAAAP